MTGPGGSQRFPRARRIRKRREFLRLQQAGRRRAGMRFVVISGPRSNESRLGITASRRVGGAVVRNRIKRLLREFFRRNQHRILPPRDVVVIARASAATATYADVRQELEDAFKINAAE